MFNQFIQDMIHMTEGEKFIYYWPLWVTIIGLVGIGIIIIKRRK